MKYLKKIFENDRLPHHSEMVQVPSFLSKSKFFSRIQDILEDVKEIFLEFDEYGIDYDIDFYSKFNEGFYYSTYRFDESPDYDYDEYNYLHGNVNSFMILINIEFQKGFFNKELFNYFKKIEVVKDACYRISNLYNDDCHIELTDFEVLKLHFKIEEGDDIEIIANHLYNHLYLNIEIDGRDIIVKSINRVILSKQLQVSYPSLKYDDIIKEKDGFFRLKNVKDKLLTI